MLKIKKKIKIHILKMNEAIRGVILVHKGVYQSYSQFLQLFDQQQNLKHENGGLCCTLVVRPLLECHSFEVHHEKVPVQASLGAEIQAEVGTQGKPVYGKA